MLGKMPSQLYAGLVAPGSPMNSFKSAIWPASNSPQANMMPSMNAS